MYDIRVIFYLRNTGFDILDRLNNKFHRNTGWIELYKATSNHRTPLRKTMYQRIRVYTMPKESYWQVQRATHGLSKVSIENSQVMTTRQSHEPPLQLVANTYEIRTQTRTLNVERTRKNPARDRDRDM